ncbi:endo-1,4-beta-xylanase [Paenibacillus barcinonensis]|uniref:Beta-xylanase n=1 Tax=Paenibacillus barcinonensis TaxID=198119 RepID=A0A2V4V191_PAEBA|nr:endo-1,4-beta-xylanase [Paenibacillus barcinonensis]PYE45439.1 endo-1,4-beta-xylanase (glycosyl hydrolase family 10) [Paenibacillus barcinonensis]QKS55255.1 endo-1,4-beta-xylanase [Paenibacillus barcinonensis]
MKRLRQWNMAFLACLLVLTTLPLATVSHASNEVTASEAREPFRTHFEDGTLQGWAPRIGSERLTVTQKEAHEGHSSMLVTQRERSYHGPMLPLKEILKPNQPYEITAYVKLAAKPDTDQTLQLTAYKKTRTESWNAVGNTRIAKDQWNTWQKITGTYQYSDDASELKLFIETPYISEDTVDTLSFYVDDVSITQVEQPKIEENIVALKDLYKDDFPIGAAVYRWQLDGAYGQLLAKHFNSLTATYEMKPKYLSPSEGVYEFEAADQYVEFAEKHHMGVRGHALLWHIDGADWMLKDAQGKPASRELLLARIKNYVETVMTRYKGKIYAWDVVNEAIADDNGDAHGLRQSPFYEIIGPDYIEKTYEFARAADPDAKLYYNEYFTEVPEKREHMYQLVKRLKEKGLIDGVGLQSHYNLASPPVEEIEKTINLFAGLGLDIQITELDVDSGIPFGEKMPAEVAVKQAYRYKELMDLYKKHKDQISSVTLWGLQDERSYNNQAMLFDTELKAKQAYWGLVDESSLPVLTQRAVSLAGKPSTSKTQQDPLWNKAVSTSLKGHASGTASFRTLWDKQNLYVLVDVQDAKVDAMDKVDVFVDFNNGKTTSYEKDDKQITIKRLGKAQSKEKRTYHVRETKGGYQVELAIPWGKVKAGSNTEIGLDIRVADGGTGGKQPPGTWYWNDRTLSQEKDMSKYGIIQLAQMPKTAQAVQGEVQIDGNQDAAWNKAVPFEVKRLNSNGSAKAVARALWSGEYLYLLIDVTDSKIITDSVNPWDQDSVEIFLDENHQRTPYFQYDDAQFRVNADNVGSFGGSASPARLESAVKKTKKGYLIEARIRLQSLKPNAGDVLGFDLQINDNQGAGKQDAVKWNDTTSESWRNTSQYGILMLSGKKK